MKHSALALVVLCLATPIAMPASAQEEQGRSLMERGAELFFRGLITEMEPALDELESMTKELEPFLRGMSSEMGPALRELIEQVDDWSEYQPPEMLPNGDIIMRRKKPADLKPAPKGEIDL